MKIEEVKRNLNKPVKFTNRRLCIEGSVYILTAGVIRKDDRGFFYQAELQDVKHENCVLICRLEEVEAM